MLTPLDLSLSLTDRPFLTAAQARSLTSEVSTPRESSMQAPMRSRSSPSSESSARVKTSFSFASSAILGKHPLSLDRVFSLGGSLSSQSSSESHMSSSS